MDAITFLDTVDELITSDEFDYLNGPAYRGAAYPDFNPECINESEFADELRAKDTFIDVDKESKRIIVEWVSQSWNDDGVDGFFDEIERMVRYLADKYELDETIVAQMSLRDRSSDNRSYRATAIYPHHEG